MNTVKEERVSFASLKDLHTVLTSIGPCLTVYMPLGGGKQDQLTFKELLRDVEVESEKFGDAGRELFKSLPAVGDLVSDQPEHPSGLDRTLVLFKSPERFQVSVVDGKLPARTVLGPHFYIRPLLSELTLPQSFYILALSQKDTRLLHCSMHDSREMPFSGQTKTSFDTWMNQVKPDHLSASTSTGVQGSADQDSRNEYLAHYFKQIDHGINELLRGRTEPLVLCGVEYELPIYRKVNSYPHLIAEDVRGAANGLKAGEMHTRAIEAIKRWHEQKIDVALVDWNHRVGGGASNRLKEVVTAAHDGRILTLLISDTQERTGSFDESTNQVKGRETGGAGDEDLVNDSAVQTILHGGNVLVAPHHKMPNGSPLAAIFRY